MPRWCAISLGGLAGAVVGIVACPMFFGAIAAVLFGDRDQGPGFLGFLVGVYVGPFVGGGVGIALAVRRTRKPRSGAPPAARPAASRRRRT